VRVEPTKEDLLGVTGAPLVREKKTGRQLEDVRSVGPWDDRELPHFDMIVGRAPRPRLKATDDVHVLDRLGSRRTLGGR
jgi:hypothetical protein